MSKISKRELHRIRRDREQQRALQVFLVLNPEENTDYDEEAQLQEH